MVKYWFSRLAVAASIFISSPVMGHDTVVSDPIDEIECLALNIYWESRDQLLEGQFAVALVTMNRVASRDFPNMVCSVVWQKAWSKHVGRYVPQFTWTLDGKPDRPLERAAWRRALWVALIVYRDMVPDFTRGAVYYHNTTALPWWRSSFVYIARIGDHLFYR